MFDADTVKKYLIEFFTSIPREDIERFIDSNHDFVSHIEKKLNDFLENGGIMKDLLIGLLRKHWVELDEFLSDPEKVIVELVRIRPDMAIVFAKKSRKEWLENQLKRIRELLYRIAWETP